MKRKLFFIFSFMMLLTMVSCVKDSEHEPAVNEQQENNARYYVKYEVVVSSRHTGTMGVTVNTENGEKTFNTSSNHFLETFGPVEKGFAARVSTSVSYSITSASSSIYVCKEGEPFVLKATGYLGASYVIDF